MSDEWKSEDVVKMLMDPRYTGMGDHERLISDEQWVEAQVKLLKQEGARNYMKKMLTLLRSFTEAELTPERQMMSDLNPGVKLN
jgi:hypothetical protein